MTSHSSFAAVFPGQGSQHVGMGKELYQEFRVARETFEEASDAVRVDLKKLCFDGPDSDLVLTENTQPCLLTSSVAAFRVARKEFDFNPGAVAGHSLGEYSALVAAEAVSLSHAVQWVRERGRAMQAAVPPGVGSMAAILGAEDSAVIQLCEVATLRATEERRKSPSTPGSAENSATAETDSSIEAIVEPANFNAPGQVVIAGSKDGVLAAIALLKEGQGFSGKAIPLQVSAPFHCRLMAPARKRMEEIFRTYQTGLAAAPRLLFPYVPNRTARLTHEGGLIFDLLIEQVDHPVLWSQSVSVLLNHGFETYYEFGPGKVLSGLIKRIGQTQNRRCNLGNVADLVGIRSLETFLKGTS